MEIASKMEIVTGEEVYRRYGEVEEYLLRVVNGPVGV